MNILLQTVSLFNTKILSQIGKRHKKLFSFGFQALSLQEFTSLNGNARSIVPNRSTAESKIFRLVSNKTIPADFSHLASTLGLVGPTDIVNVDFSTFCGFEVLTFAKQTVRGRAIPLYFNLLTYPITDETSQTVFVMGEIARFKKIFGFCPPLVFDRGFTLPLLVQFLIREKITFYLRMKKDKYVTYRDRDLPLRCLPWWENDTTVTVYDHDVRIVRSPKKGDEPWYILTNDMHSSRDQVVARYYFRFEIEETFKDLKHVGRLKRFFIRKKATVRVLLWFAILSIWLAVLIGYMHRFLASRVRHNTHKRLSFIKQFFEQLTLSRTLLVQEAYAL